MTPLNHFFKISLQGQGWALRTRSCSRFDISVGIVSNIIDSWANFLYLKLGSLSIWPSNEKILEKMPESFGSEYKDTGYNYSSAKIVLSKLNITFGSLQSASCLALNHLIILGKYFLHVNALNNCRYHYSDFLSLINDKIGPEKYIATTSNQKISL